MQKRLTPEQGLQQLAQAGRKDFMALFHHGTLEVGIYKPDGIDHQKPHVRDEIYVVISGKGTFVKGEDRHPFQAGEVLFAPAGVAHRFEDFSDDFTIWVFFYGPEGGESPHG